MTQAVQICVLLTAFCVMATGLPMSGVELRVVTIQSEPYMSVDPGDGSFFGYIPDLLDKLKEQLGFTYNLSLSPDGRYGAQDVNGNWNGMIGELIKNERDPSKGFHLAAAPITITKGRERVVDFIQPFAHVGYSVMIQRPDKRKDAEPSKPWHFNFNVFVPLSVECWVVIILVMLVVWMFFWLMNMFNPYEYGNRYKRNLATEGQSELFSITGSMWFTFTTLQWQGYDRAPRSVASKIMGCFWMAFITLTIITYISSFLNYMFWASIANKGDPTAPPVRDLVDLVNHKNGYTYGTTKGGSNYAYLTQVARATEFKKMALYWSSEEGKADLVVSTAEGVERVRNNKYAFIGETMFIRHAVSTAPECDLMDLGVTFGMRSYGLAIPEGYEHEEALNTAILHLIQEGDIEALEIRWFDDGQCHEQLRTKREALSDEAFYLDKPQPVTLGVFWSSLTLLIVGLFVSTIAAGAEILWYRYKGKHDVNNRHLDEQLTDENPHIRI